MVFAHSIGYVRRNQQTQPMCRPLARGPLCARGRVSWRILKIRDLTPAAGRDGLHRLTRVALGNTYLQLQHPGPNSFFLSCRNGTLANSSLVETSTGITRAKLRSIRGSAHKIRALRHGCCLCLMSKNVEQRCRSQRQRGAYFVFFVTFGGRTKDVFVKMMIFCELFVALSMASTEKLFFL